VKSLKNYINEHQFDVFVNSTKILKALYKSFSIDNVYSEKINELKIFCKKKNIFLKKIKKNLNKFNNVNKRKIAIICGVSKIFSKEEIKLYENRMINIHFGDLPKYRGRHPLTWAFIKNEKRIGCTIHLINEKIDQGYILNKFFIRRKNKDSAASIEKKILKSLPVNLNKAFLNLRINKIKKISKGKYYPPLYNGINIINTNKHNRTFIINCINAQYSYGGVTINNDKFKKFSLKKKKNYRKFLCKNNKKIYLL
jgi:methionyl-tRNA formyltransferase